MVDSAVRRAVLPAIAPATCTQSISFQCASLTSLTSLTSAAHIHISSAAWRRRHQHVVRDVRRLHARIDDLARRHVRDNRVVVVSPLAITVAHCGCLGHAAQHVGGVVAAVRRVPAMLHDTLTCTHNSTHAERRRAVRQRGTEERESETQQHHIAVAEARTKTLAEGARTCRR